MLALRHRAGLQAGRRVVHLHGRAEGQDRKRGSPGALDTWVRAATRARLAAQHGRLDDLQEALLGAGAAYLQVHRLRARGRDRQRDGAGGAGRGGLGGLRRPLAAPPVDRRREDPVHRVRGDRLAHPRRGQRLARRGHRPLLDDRLPERPGPLEGVVPSGLDIRELPRPVQGLVLLAPRDEHGAGGHGALPQPVQLRDHAGREGRRDAQEQGQRHLVRGWGRAHGGGLHALALLASGPHRQPELRVRHGGRGAPQIHHTPVERLLVLRHLRETSTATIPPRRGRRSSSARSSTAG